MVRKSGARPSWSNGRRRGTAGQEAAEVYLPREKYPPAPTPRTRPLTSAEHAHIDHYRRLRQKLHDSALYTILDPSARIQKPGELTGAWKPHAQVGSKKAMASPFETMATYSHKYKKRRRTMPELDEREYVKAFFPVELHPLIDPSSAPQATRSKRSNGQLQDHDVVEDGEKIAEEEDEEVVEEEQDNDFEEDEEDDEDGPDDYNAEQYFDNGEGDLDDEGGGDYE